MKRYHTLLILLFAVLMSSVRADQSRFFPEIGMEFGVYHRDRLV
jgi:hypothetical protein